MGELTDELHLQMGEVVEILSAKEILDTLDSNGTFDGLPFMPEMLPLCGQRFRVFRRAHKTCDTITWSGLRGMDRTVHLEGLRCDGSAHGGCQAGCLLFWKVAWLRRVATEAQEQEARATTPAAGNPAIEQWLRERSQNVLADGDVRFRCQATEMLQATYPLSVLNPLQYVRDVRSNGATWAGVIRGVGLSAINCCRRFLKQPTRPRVVGELRRTPHVELGLEPGEWVEVKSHKEILATLDRLGKNRGLSFDSEMVSYCGRRFRVLRRVETIVDETSGKLRRLPGVCIVLEEVVCRGLYHRSCPRSIYPYWREIWLRRVEKGEPPACGYLA
jgi:hypothetical protein